MSGARIVRVPFREQLSDAYRVWFSVGLIGAAVLVTRLLPVAHGVAQAIVVGAIAGIVGHWRASVPATITIGVRFAGDARQWFERRGYAARPGGDGLVPKLPRPLRFDSQNVRLIREGDEALTIVAPYFLLKAYAKSAGL